MQSLSCSVSKVKGWFHWKRGEGGYMKTNNWSWITLQSYESYENNNVTNATTLACQHHVFVYILIMQWSYFWVLFICWFTPRLNKFRAYGDVTDANKGPFSTPTRYREESPTCIANGASVLRSQPTLSFSTCKGYCMRTYSLTSGPYIRLDHWYGLL